MSLHRGVHLADLELAPNEAGDPSRQVPRTHIQCPQGREPRAGPCSYLEHTDWVGRSRNRRGPKSTRSTPVSRPAVDSANRICPPCPAAITRAARLSTAPK